MCGRPGSDIIEFAVMAIAAGAGDQKLAEWALSERDRIEEIHRNLKVDFSSSPFMSEAVG